MTARPKIDMVEATRLTRAGRLSEAMALLRGAPIPPPGNIDRDTGPRQDRRPPPLFDLIPVSDDNSSSASGSNRPNPANRGPSMIQARLRGTLSGLLARLPQLRTPPGLDGLVRPEVYPPISLPEGARFDECSFANEAGSRTYKLYVPSGYNGQPVSLVVMLHGCTQSPDDFAAGTRMNEVAEEQTFLVAYPAQPQSANSSKCWNWFNAADQQRDRGEPALIAGITRLIMRDFPVERDRVYVAGLSAGGAAAAIMGSTYPDLYAAIGVHSGLACGAARDLPSAFTAMRQGGFGVAAGSRRATPVPTIVFHGDRDTTVNPVNADQVIAQSKAKQVLRTTVTRGTAPGGINYTRAVQSDETGRPLFEQWVLHGAGHAWSGGSPAGSYTEPRGPDASREMMRFFLSFPSNASTSGGPATRGT